MAERVTIEYIAPRDTNEIGDPIGPMPQPAPVRRVRYWPRTSAESGTEVVIDGYGLHIPRLPAEIEKLDAKGHIKFLGKTWEIDGVPGFFGRKGYIVYLKRVGS